MNAGRLLEFAYFVAFWFFIVSVFLFPVSLQYWKAREKRRAEETEAALKSLGFDRSNNHIYDA